MREFTYSEATKQLGALLDLARREGAVRIRRRDGQLFVLRPDRGPGSPLDVPGLELDLDRKEIVALVHTGRQDAMNRVMTQLNDPVDGFARRAAHRVLDRSEWSTDVHATLFRDGVPDKHTVGELKEGIRRDVAKRRPRR